MPQGRNGGPKVRPAHLKLVPGSGRRGRPPKQSAGLRLPPGMPDPPSFLRKEAVEEWRRGAPALFEAGLLTQLDAAVLAAYATSYGRWIQAERQLGEILLAGSCSGSPMQHPLL